MRDKGIAYDTGFVRHGQISIPSFDLDRVRRELTIIRDDLHCNAVHLIGGDPDRLEQAARCAAHLGLEVWLSPYPLELTPTEILALFTECADRAERVRHTGAEVVFVAGVELSIMNRGFFPGEPGPRECNDPAGHERRREGGRHSRHPRRHVCALV